MLERFGITSKHIALIITLLLLLGGVFLFIYLAIAETKERFISVAVRGIFSQAKLIKHFDKNVDFDISSLFPFKIEDERVDHKTFIEEMSKSAPVEEHSCIKAIIPLKGENRALFISSPQEELFDYLSLLDRYSIC